MNLSSRKSAIVWSLILISGLYGCASLRHKLVITSDVVATSLEGISQTSDVALKDGIINLNTRKLIAEKLIIAINADQGLVTVLQNWKPGDPVPPQLVTILNAVNQASSDIINVLPESPDKKAMQQSVNNTIFSIAEILVQLKAK